MFESNYGDKIPHPKLWGRMIPPVLLGFRPCGYTWYTEVWNNFFLSSPGLIYWHCWQATIGFKYINSIYWKREPSFDFKNAQNSRICPTLVYSAIRPYNCVRLFDHKTIRRFDDYNFDDSRVCRRLRKLHIIMKRVIDRLVWFFCSHRVVRSCRLSSSAVWSDLN